MRLLCLALTLFVCAACERAEVSETNLGGSASAEPTEIEAEVEARAEAVASHLIGRPASAITLTTIEGQSIALGANPT